MSDLVGNPEDSLLTLAYSDILFSALISLCASYAGHFKCII